MSFDYSFLTIVDNAVSSLSRGRVYNILSPLSNKWTVCKPAVFIKFLTACKITFWHGD